MSIATFHECASGFSFGVGCWYLEEIRQEVEKGNNSKIHGRIAASFLYDIGTSLLIPRLWQAVMLSPIPSSFYYRHFAISLILQTSSYLELVSSDNTTSDRVKRCIARVQFCFDYARSLIVPALIVGHIALFCLGNYLYPLSVLFPLIYERISRKGYSHPKIDFIVGSLLPYIRSYARIFNPSLIQRALGVCSLLSTMPYTGQPFQHHVDGLLSYITKPYKRYPRPTLRSIDAPIRPPILSDEQIGFVLEKDQYFDKKVFHTLQQAFLEEKSLQQNQFDAYIRTASDHDLLTYTEQVMEDVNIWSPQTQSLIGGIGNLRNWILSCIDSPLESPDPIINVAHLSYCTYTPGLALSVDFSKFLEHFDKIDWKEATTFQFLKLKVLDDNRFYGDLGFSSDTPDRSRSAIEEALAKKMQMPCENSHLSEKEREQEFIINWARKQLQTLITSLTEETGTFSQRGKYLNEARPKFARIAHSLENLVADTLDHQNLIAQLAVIGGYCGSRIAEEAAMMSSPIDTDETPEARFERKVYTALNEVRTQIVAQFISQILPQTGADIHLVEEAKSLCFYFLGMSPTQRKKLSMIHIVFSYLPPYSGWKELLFSTYETRLLPMFLCQNTSLISADIPAPDWTEYLLSTIQKSYPHLYQRVHDDIADGKVSNLQIQQLVLIFLGVLQPPTV